MITFEAIAPDKYAPRVFIEDPEEYSWTEWLEGVNAIRLFKQDSYATCMYIVNQLGAVIATSKILYPIECVAPKLIIGIKPNTIKDILLLRQLDESYYSYRVFAVGKTHLIPFVQGGVF